MYSIYYLRLLVNRKYDLKMSNVMRKLAIQTMFQQALTCVITLFEFAEERYSNG